MLGGGNPVGGSNPAGTSGSINFVGDHCYGYSGNITSAGAASADTAYLDFTMPDNTYAVGWLNISELNAGNTAERFVDVLIDGQKIVQIKADGNPDFLNNFPIPLLLPPGAHIEAKCGVNGGAEFAVTFRGRAYQ
tara:strand:- start:1102 stop:1506 length:405 start_codon:yes stop_codon:yes gene_type:complete